MKVVPDPQKPDDGLVVEVLISGDGWQQVAPGSFKTNGLFAHWIDPNRTRLRTVVLTAVLGYARESEIEDFTG